MGISVGDLVVNGNEIRVVQSLEYGDGNERTHYRYMTLRGHFGNGLTVVHTTGTDNTFYRITVEKEIREALRALPNGRIQDVTVEAITNGGYFTGVSTMSNGYTVAGTANLLATGKSGTVQTADANKAAFDVTDGGVIKFSTNTHAFTMSDVDSDGKITFATDTFTALKAAALTGTKPAITGHATGGSSASVATTTNGDGSGLVVTVVTADGTPPTLTSVTVTTAGTGYKPGDVITVTGAGNSNAGEFNSFSMTLQRDDFAAAENLRAGFYNAEHTVTGTPTTTKFRAAGAGCSGSGTAINYEVYGDVTSLATNDGSAVQTAVPVNGINYGDTIRVGDEFRRVVDDTGRHYATGAPGKIFRLSSGFAVPATRDTVLGFATAVPAPIFKQNGMMYDITFESGCRTHADCRNNGIDENASDGPDPTPLVEGNDMGAVCRPGGACICSSDSYFGDGCTTDGRGSHAAPKKYVSGNINNLECDKSGLTPSIPLRVTATVSRANPRKVVLTATAEHDDHLPYTLTDHVTAVTTDLALPGTVGGTDLVVTDDELNGLDIIFTKGASSLGLSKTFADSTATGNKFTTVTGTGGKHADTDVVKYTNLANSVKVGDKIRIEGQVRTVTYVSSLCQRGVVADNDKNICPSLTSSHYLMVEEDFVEDEFSTHDNIFEPLTVVERVESDSSQVATKGADLATCVVTDIRQLSSTTSTCDNNDGPTCGGGYVDDGEMRLSGGSADNRRVTLTSGTEASHNAALMDSREVEIGDRIRFTKPNTGTDSAAEVWKTRTVDSVTYSVELDIDGSSKYTLFDGMVHQFAVTEAFSSAHSAQAVYNDGSGTMESKVCSGRGLCDESTGECACFAGYTDVDCSVQNALSI